MNTTVNISFGQQQIVASKQAQQMRAILLVLALPAARAATGGLGLECGEITTVPTCQQYACLPTANSTARACGLCASNSDCNYGFDTLYNKCYNAGTPDAVCRTKPLFDPFTWQDGLTSVFIFLSGLIASGAGIGGGGLYVPLFVIFAWGKVAVERSLAATSGLSVAMMCIIFWQKHPDADFAYGRPLVNYRAMLVFEPIVLLGTVVGRLLYKILPTVIVYFMLLVLLFATSVRTWQKVGTQCKRDQAAKVARESVANDAADTAADAETAEGLDGAITDEWSYPTERELVRAFVRRAKSATAIRRQLENCRDTLNEIDAAKDSAEFKRVQEFIASYTLLNDSEKQAEKELGACAKLSAAVGAVLSKAFNPATQEEEEEEEAVGASVVAAAEQEAAEAEAAPAAEAEAAPAAEAAATEAAPAETVAAEAAPAPAAEADTAAVGAVGAAEAEGEEDASALGVELAGHPALLTGDDAKSVEVESVVVNFTPGGYLPALQVEDIMAVLEKKWTAPTPAMPFLYPTALMCRVGVVLAQSVTPNVACVPSDGDATPAALLATERVAAAKTEATEEKEPTRTVLLRDRPVTVQQRAEYRTAVKALMVMFGEGRKDGALDVVQFRKLVQHLTSTEWGVHDILRRESYQVSVLLYTVTFYANLAHSLTRSP